MFGGSGGCAIKAIGLSSLYVNTSFGISLMKKSRPIQSNQHAIFSANSSVHTYYQAFHLIFSYDFHAQRFRYLIVVLERATTGCHDTQVFRLGAIVMLLVGLELAHELYACVYPVRLELEEVQSAAD
jgi:hypothetical protein